jgi:putative PIN family toxin of toxin-antitoxin system
MRAVFDTNVLVSALITPSGRPGRALRLAAQGRFELFLSRAILDELLGVLARPFFRERLGDPRIASHCVDLLATGFPLAPIEADLLTAVDPKDRHAIASALGCRAQYLVTGDRKPLLPLRRVGGVEIIDAGSFLLLFE